jgi:L-alanine-DL-glutamate epimerase-like enolase superfamily enzyme
MKITRVEAIALEAPMQGHYVRARMAQPIQARRCLLVKITTDAGLSGYGEGLTPLAPQAAGAVVRQVLAPLLIGQNPLNTELIWDSMYSVNSSRGYNRGYQMIAIGAVDTALWDLKGKIIGQPVYQMLGGGFNIKLPIYSTGLMMAETDELLALAQSYYDEGFRAMKLKIGIDANRDLEGLRVLREHFGAELKLMVDANGAYDSATAIKLGRKFEELDIFWFEEPVLPDDIDGLVRVRQNVGMYVAAGESEYTKFGFRELFQRKAIDICQPDVGRAGGITECKKIAALAQAFNVHYAPHAWGGAVLIAASAHLAASLPNFLIFEVDRMSNPLRDELPLEKLPLKDGFLHLPDKPGLGIELDQEQIERFTIDSL